MAVTPTITLADRGRTDYRIILGDGASPSEEFAAAELQRHLEQITGLRLPIGRDRDRAAPHEIVLGWHQRARDARLRVDRAQAGASGFHIVPVGEKLYILGSPERGTLYGALSLLEDDLGCRWYAPDVSVTLPRPTVTLPAEPRSERPAFERRDVAYHEFLANPEFAARNRITNSWSTVMQARHGGASPWAGSFCHTFARLVPPAEYFPSHPEYFALVNGQRTDAGQLCLSHPAVLRLVIERVGGLLRQSPGQSLVSVSQNDTAGYCECDTCRRLDQQEGSPAASLIHFVNRVADALAPEFPAARFHTFAYQYGRRPPRTLPPRPNVLVEFCSIECSFAEPLAGGACPANRALCADLAGWRALGAHLCVWDYVVRFSHYLIPFPNYEVLAPNLRYFAESGLTGVVEQGNYTTSGGELSLLRGWVLAKLLWNPQRDPAALVRDFVMGYYAEAARPVLAYLAYLAQRVAAIRPELFILGTLPAAFYTSEFAETADRFWADAEALATTPAIKRRVELSRLSTRYARLILAPRPPEPTLAAMENARRFFAIAEREGITHHDERTPLAKLKEQFATIVEQGGA